MHVSKQLLRPFARSLGGGVSQVILAGRRYSTYSERPEDKKIDAFDDGVPGFLRWNKELNDVFTGDGQSAPYSAPAYNAGITEHMMYHTDRQVRERVNPKLHELTVRDREIQGGINALSERIANAHVLGNRLKTELGQAEEAYRQEVHLQQQGNRETDRKLGSTIADLGSLDSGVDEAARWLHKKELQVTSEFNSSMTAIGIRMRSVSERILRLEQGGKRV